MPGSWAVHSAPPPPARRRRPWCSGGGPGEPRVAPDALRYAILPLISYSACAEAGRYAGRVYNNSMFCAGALLVPAGYVGGAV